VKQACASTYITLASTQGPSSSPLQPKLLKFQNKRKKETRRREGRWRQGRRRRRRREG